MASTCFDEYSRALLATIRDQGVCPCPRCIIQKDMIPFVGTASDINYRKLCKRKDTEQRIKLVKRASNLIYKKGAVVKSKKVEDLLQSSSMVPTMV